jgi:ferric-dicitrate binding protein FerR (iron transport regulator)
LDAFDTQAQAAEWLIRLDADRSAATLAQWRLWLGEDARHDAAYRRLEIGWQQTDCLKRLRPLDGAVDAGVLDTFPGERTSLAAQPPPSRLDRLYRKLAAVLAASRLRRQRPPQT